MKLAERLAKTLSAYTGSTVTVHDIKVHPVTEVPTSTGVSRGA